MISVAPPFVQNSPIDATAVREAFPLLRETASDGRLHYLDNAATTQKPNCVIDAISDCYRNHYGPINRGLYPLADAATSRYAQARQRLARFIGAARAEEIVFTRSTTEAINLVAWGWARQKLAPGDRVWVSRMEHHSNYLPWQRVCQERGAELRIIELQEDGRLDIAHTPELFDARTRLIAVCQVSNVLGLENPLAELCATAHAQGIAVLVDAAQSVSHLPLDVARLGCDFLACSAHKMYGPSGIGLLYGRAEQLADMQPLLLGGGMVDLVGEGNADSRWLPYPECFEAGSPNLAGTAGFAAAADYLDTLGRSRVHTHVQGLTRSAAEALSALPGLRLLADGGSSLLSFTLAGVHPHDLAQYAGECGVAIRAGHHCAQPLHQSLGLEASARASFAVYNDMADVLALVDAIDRARRLFAGE